MTSSGFEFRAVLWREGRSALGLSSGHRERVGDGLNEMDSPCMCDDNVVERGVGPPEPGESDFDDHCCLETSG